MSLLEQRYVNLGESFDASSITLKPSLRINTLKISETDFLKRMRAKNVILEKIPFTDVGYWFEAPFPMASSEEYLLGLFYIQEAASQLPAKVLLDDLNLATSDSSDISILDLCSAPGSKTTQLAQLTNDLIPILALDSVSPRLDVLEFNLERLGIKSVSVIKKDGMYVDDFDVKFDYILVDAPCSGNFCVEKDFFTKRTVNDFNAKSRDQKKLLSAAIRVLKEGGIIVYSTCSLEPEEDELVIQWLLDTFDDLEVVETGLTIGDSGLTKVFDTNLNPDISKTRRFWPHKTGTEGFFIAKLKKSKSV